MFRRILIAATCAASLVVATPAIASGVPTHSCNVPWGQVIASGYTSCSFATTIVSTWHRGQCWRYSSCSGWAHSNVTGRNYSLYCERFGNSSYSNNICRTSGHDSWVRFSWASY